MGRDGKQGFDLQELLDRLERQASRIGELEAENRMLRGESTRPQEAFQVVLTPNVVVDAQAPDGSGRRLVRAPYPESKRAEDAASIMRDLALTRIALQRLRGMRDNPLSDTVTREALWSTALVSYARCFASGKRFHLTEAIFDGVGEPGAEAVNMHRYLKAMRDKHIAHSVNPFEQSQAALAVPEPDGEGEGEITVFMRGARLTGWDDDGLRSFAACVEIAQRHMEQELNAAMDALWKRALADDRAKLRSYPDVRFVVPQPSEVFKPRQ